MKKERSCIVREWKFTSETVDVKANGTNTRDMEHLCSKSSEKFIKYFIIENSNSQKTPN